MKRKNSRHADMMGSTIKRARDKEASLYADAADREKARADAADARVRELEAQCAAMREALEIVVSAEEDQNGEISDYGFEAIRAALSGDAGRALLERVGALERVAGAARVVKKHGYFGDDASNLDAAVDIVDALEPKR